MAKSQARQAVYLENQAAQQETRAVRLSDASLTVLDTIRCSLNYNTPNEQYKYNVQMYLIYVMSKEEFKNDLRKRSELV